MATRNILKEGDKGLLKESRTVTDFNKRLHVLLDDMRETLIEANGLGLAAPQVGVLRRVVLIVDTGIENERDDEEGAEGSEEQEAPVEFDISEHIIELINPEIITECGEQTGSEGCLSLPGVYGMVTRPETVVVRAQNRHGEVFEIEVNELTARAACHEVDHLNGVLFTSLAERLLTEEELAGLAAQKDEQDTEDS
jgi:peptide deformylase